MLKAAFSVNLNLNSIQKSISSADFSADLSHFSTANGPYLSHSKPAKPKHEPIEGSFLEKELRWGSKKPRTPRKPQLMSEQELDSILDDFQMSDDFPLSNDFQIPDDFEFQDFLQNAFFKSDGRASQEKMTGKVPPNYWKSRYTQLKEDPIKYEAYLVKKRKKAKMNYDMKQEMKRKLEAQSRGDAKIQPVDLKTIKNREYNRKYLQKLKQNPEAHRQYLDHRNALRKMRIESKKQLKQA